MRPDDIEIVLSQCRIALRIQKYVAQHHVAAVLERACKRAGLIAINPERFQLLQKSRRRGWAEVGLQFLQRVQGGITFGNREGDVKGDHARAARGQLVYQRSEEHTSEL